MPWRKPVKHAQSALLVTLSVFAFASGAAVAHLSAGAQSRDRGFEAATIRINQSGERGSRGDHVDDRYNIRNITLFNLLQIAYGVSDSQVAGAPAWSKSEHYDIAAIGPAGKMSRQDERAMWQKFLAERFSLQTHTEKRTVDAANLVLARKDRKLGPRLHPATAADSDCTKSAPTGDINELQPCSAIQSFGRIRARGIPIARLVDWLAGGRTSTRIIFDHTNLDGTFNIDLLEYRPDGASAAPPPEWNVDVAPWPSPDLPPIYTALQEQLGLKMEFVKGRTDVIVVDHVARPSTN